ncbi:unnamed protein product [Cylicocyclus nassatus]|uniref:SCP domain-containing protein n=1 Tax=Cylicocyclus nassatus TaxID=53992 RepID=A0AA36GNS5_CYLNA|nr:unnamed protein product [Cylicocyclus nassatus]
MNAEIAKLMIVDTAGFAFSVAAVGKALENEKARSQDYDYYDPDYPPLCPNGKMDEYTIDDFIVRNLNVNYRLQLLKGVEKIGTTMPKGKVMKALQWDCDLEQAAINALPANCPEDKPVALANKTGIFYSLNIGIQPDILTAMDFWTSEKKKVSVNVDGTAVRYVNSSVTNYLNLMRSTASKIGCAEHTCKEGDLYKFRAYCITNAPLAHNISVHVKTENRLNSSSPLQNNDVMYEVGNGGCLKGDNCPTGSNCVTFGLCKDI